MVVDLLRNDMGRIAETGSVAVPQLWRVERHPSVWQLTSTVTARTPPETGLADVFGALFPCASVTGAPKISAMAIIAELERAPRGVYCGAVGLIRPDPSGSKPHGVSARFAVGIRTAVIDKARLLVEYGSGGGITWDSSPEAEWEEVLIKTKALVDAVTVGRCRPRPDRDDGLPPRRRWWHRAQSRGPPRPPLVFRRVLRFPRPDGSRSTRRQGHRRTERRPPDCASSFVPTAAIDVSTSTLENHDRPPGVQRLCVDPEPVASTNPALFHKTTDRRRYEERAQRHPSADDVVLVNERSELTETTRANLAVCLRGQWCTPPLDCGLLPGIERARLIASGRLIEKVITVEDLHRAEGAATLSSLRGWRAAHICPDCSC